MTKEYNHRINFRFPSTVMLTNSLHTKWMAQLLVLIYLLLMTSTGNAFFWCKDAEAPPHLEANLGGRCWIPCATDTEQHPAQTSNAGVTFSSGTGDCLDTPAYYSTATPAHQNRPKSKVSTADIDKPNSVCITAKRLSAEDLSSRPHSHQLPLRQTLASLRTVVLLH